MSKQQCRCITQKGTQCTRISSPPDYLCGQHDSGKCKDFITTGQMPGPAPAQMAVAKPKAKSPIAQVAKPKLTVHGPISIEIASEKVVEALKTINDFYSEKKKTMTIEKLANVLCTLFTKAKEGELSIKQAQSPYIEKILKDLPAVIARDVNPQRREYNADIVLKSAKALKFMFDTVCGFNDGGSGTRDSMGKFLSDVTEIAGTVDRYETHEAMMLRMSLFEKLPTVRSHEVVIPPHQVRVNTKQDLAPPIQVPKPKPTDKKGKK